MAKKNALVDRMQQIRRETFLTTQHFTRQLCLDQASIVLNRDFGFGAERLMRFNAAMVEMYGEYADIWNTDTSDVEYSKTKMDMALKQIYGDLFVPWEVRYRVWECKFEPKKKGDKHEVDASHSR